MLPIAIAAEDGDYEVRVNVLLDGRRTITVRSFTEMWASATNALLGADLTDAINTLVPLTHTMYAWPNGRQPMRIPAASKPPTSRLHTSPYRVCVVVEVRF